MLLDLAQFQNVNQNAQMAIAGQHKFGNLITGAKSQTQFKDTPNGQYSVVANTVQNGQMSIQGNHQFENFTNNGNTSVLPRAYNPDGSPAQLIMLQDLDFDLEDLATFKNFSNKAGGNAQFEGTHTVKNMNNAKKGNVNFKDNKNGQFATVENTINKGQIQASGLHQFNNAQNSGQFNVAPRGFDAKGNPVKLVMLDEDFDLEDLATFNNFQNQDGGQATFEGTHTIKNLSNAKKGQVIFKDNRTGQYVTVGNTNNMGQMQVSGLHQFDNTQNSGQFNVAPRGFDAKGNPVKLIMLDEDFDLEDLATFNNFQNQDGGVAQFEGTHTIKNLSNAKKGQVVFRDNRTGQYVTVGNTNNMGQMQVSGLHQFDNTQNSGQFNVAPRGFDAKGRPVPQLLLL